MFQYACRSEVLRQILVKDFHFLKLDVPKLHLEPCFLITGCPTLHRSGWEGSSLETEVTQWGIFDRSEFKQGRIISCIITFLRSGMTLESKFTQCTVHKNSIFHKKSSSWIISTIRSVFGKIHQFYCWWKKSCTSWYWEHPMSGRISYKTGGLAGFLPSTVSHFRHQRWGWSLGIPNFRRCQSGSGTFSTTQRTHTEIRCMQCGFNLRGRAFKWSGGGAQAWKIEVLNPCI